MTKWHKMGVMIGGMLMLLAMLAACGPSASTSTGGGNTPKKGGSIVDIYNEEPDSLLPWNTTETFGVMAQYQVWAPLWALDQNGQVTLDGGIAKEIPSTSNGDVSADLTTFTIKLKSGLKWSDGTPETANDCVASWKLMSDPQAGDADAFPTTAPTDAFQFVSATVIDSTTAQIKFAHPNSPFVVTMAGAAVTCMPAEELQGKTGAQIFGASNSQNFQPTVTNGPYTIKERVAGSHITVVRNPNYFLAPAQPYLDQITDQIIADSNTVLQAFQSGSADVAWFLDATKTSDYKGLSGYTTALDPGSNFEWLLFNMHNKFLQDKVVRQALSESIDPPNEIYQAVLHGAAKQTCDDDPGNFAHEPNLVPCYKYNPTDAANILKADGYTMGTDGYLHNASSATLELEYATTALQRREDTQAIFIQDWKKIGIKVDQKNYSNTQDWFGTPGGHLCQGTFDIGEFESSAPDPDDHTTFSSDQSCLGPKHGVNYMFYSNPQVDAAEADQLTTADITKRKADFHTIHQQIINDLPVRYLFAPADLYTYKNTVHNYLPAGTGDDWNVQDWYLS